MDVFQIVNVIPLVIVEEEDQPEGMVEVMATEIDNKMETIQFFKYFHNILI